MTKIQKILEYAMRMEKDAQEFYSYYCGKVSSPDIKTLFENLVEMEKSHFNYLKDMFEKLNFSNPPVSISWVVDNSAKEVNTSIFSDNSDLLNNNETSITDLSVIRLAYLMESDFALFYSNAANAIEDLEVKKFLDSLAKWEIEHREMFKKKYEALLKEHWGEVSSVILG